MSTSRTSLRFLSLSSTTRISAPAMSVPHRELERERRADAELALEPQVAAMELDEASREREPEPRPFVLLREVAPDLPELLEDDLLVLGRDPDAGVGDGDLDDLALEM